MITPTPKIKSPASLPLKHQLVGAGLHWKDRNGCVQNQAEIIAIIPSGCTIVGDLALIQYFDWIVGHSSTRRLIPLRDLAASEQWVFYSSVEEMNDHYERVDQYHPARKATRDPAVTDVEMRA